MRMLLSDSVHLISNNADSQSSILYSEENVVDCVHRIECVDFKQRITVDGITFTLYNAGHVLGAAMVLVEIAGVRVLYTGDYSAEEDRHLMAAEVPAGVLPDVLITECTFGINAHTARAQRERDFKSMVETVVTRGGRCLVPVFALGRAQELLLLLEEMWAASPHLQRIPIFFASALATKALEVYRTYISHMNNRIQSAMLARNPWDFQFITGLRSQRDFKDTGPCVVLASPGMLQHGFSRRLFDAWAEEERNGIIIAGYNVENTLARTLMQNPQEVQALNGRRMLLRASVRTVEFAAHADGMQTSRFIDLLKPSTIVLVHGEKNEMKRLHLILENKYKDTSNFQSFMPENTETVRVLFSAQRQVKVLGGLAGANFNKVTPVGGVLLSHNFEYSLLAAADVPKQTQLVQQRLTQRQHVPFWASFAALGVMLTRMFDSVVDCAEQTTSPPSAAAGAGGSGGGAPHSQGGQEDLYAEQGAAAAAVQPGAQFNQIVDVDAHRKPSAAVLVDGIVRVEHFKDRLMLAWDSSPVADSTADSIVALAAQVAISPLNLTLTKSLCSHSHSGGHDHDHQEHSSAGAPASPSEGPSTEQQGTGEAHTPGRNASGPSTSSGADADMTTPPVKRTALAVPEAVAGGVKSSPLAMATPRSEQEADSVAEDMRRFLCHKSLKAVRDALLSAYGEGCLTPQAVQAVEEDTLGAATVQVTVGKAVLSLHLGSGEVQVVSSGARGGGTKAAAEAAEAAAAAAVAIGEDLQRMQELVSAAVRPPVLFS